MTDHHDMNRLTNLINNLGFELAQTNEDLLDTLSRLGDEAHDYHYQRTEARLKRLRTLQIKKP